MKQKAPTQIDRFRSNGILMNIVLGVIGHFELLWGPPRGMDLLPDCRVYWRGLADLDRAGSTGDTPASLNQPIAQHSHLGR
jgi:hypothetical protein